MSNLEIVEGKEVRIIFEAKKCIHSRGCVLSRPDVFVPNVQGEWIHPDAATPAEIAELAHRCPSGAISYELINSSLSEKAPKVNLVTIRENGPLAFHGELNIEASQPSFRATLCRCGHSKNKPYCDGSHSSEGFVASGEVAVKESTVLEKRDGKLNVNLAPDGPLIVSGAVEIITGTGKTVNRTDKAFLCRCGHSANKPYCDGSHAKVGFKS